MQCFNPYVMQWYRPEFRNDRPYGLEKPIWYGRFMDLDDAFLDKVKANDDDFLSYYVIPCGTCDACRRSNMQQWQFRAMCELDVFSVSSFITFTVDDEHMSEVFPDERLCHRPFQLFMKKFRKAVKQSVSYLMCGEYGTNTFRPHYHVILFGWFPPDYVLLERKPRYDVFTSQFISNLWRKDLGSSSYGFHTIGVANEQTIKYLVGYVMKKSHLPDLFTDSPPYLRASTKPALGYSFFNAHKDELFSMSEDLQFDNSFVYCGHQKIALPRYFTKKFSEVSSNVDYVLFQNYRRLKSDSRPLYKSDLERVRDYFEQRTKWSHNFRENEV